MTATVTRSNIHEDVTQQIINLLEQGKLPWHQPWDAEHLAGSVSRPLRHSGMPYSGINVIMLWLQSMMQGYSNPLWLSFNQAKQLGGSVKKGEKGTKVVYFSTMKKEHIDDQGEVTEKDIGYLKTYFVFNGEQVSGLPDHFYARKSPPQNLEERLDHVEQFIHRTGAEIRQGGNRAYYSPAQDYIQVPPYDSFKDRSSFYATLLHEATHWTRAESRLNRSFGQKRFGDTGYAMEELVAELASAFLCADLGITPIVREDHAAYLQHWLAVLRQDSKAIFLAAGYAEKAVGFLNGLQA